MVISAAAARKWDNQTYEQRANWWMSAACQAHYNNRVCGQPVTGSSEGCRIRLREAIGDQTLERGISIGCGPGDKERALLHDGLVRHMDLWEISLRLAELGEREARLAGLEKRVTYHLGDAFAEKPSGTYDLVYWDHALHHMSDVDAAVAWSVEALRPGGWLLVNDYIGPNRLQWTRDETDAANQFLSTTGIARKLPHLNLLDRLKQIRRDPSEAPQSELIWPAMMKRLIGMRYVSHLGGVFLNLLGPVVVPITDEDSPALAAMLEADEELLHRGGSHFVFALWQRPLEAAG